MNRPVLVSSVDLAVWRQQAIDEAIAADISAQEVDWLLQSFCDLDKLSLRLQLFKSQPEIVFSRPWLEIQDLWKQRLIARVPLQYLIGELTWRKFRLQVAPGVLIPRPETELLIDLVLSSNMAKNTAKNTANLQGDWADLGTGSGAIALSLADTLPLATLHAVDRSSEALEIARANASEHNLHSRIHFYQGSWFEPLQHLRGKLVGAIANPPYIPTALVSQLQPEVADHEPHLALDGGSDGLECIRILVNSAPRYLQSGGLWLVEMMAGQASQVQALLEDNGNYTQIQIHPDLAGIERFALAYRR